MSFSARRLTVFSIVTLVVLLSFFSGLSDHLSLQQLKLQQSSLDSLYRSHQTVVCIAYFFTYVLVSALSIPGAALLTLAAGAIFGVTLGTLIVSFASTIGATFAFVLSRYLLRDWIQKKFGDRLTRINSGIEREGAFYLFSLRLVPIFPFFLINLLMGLTPIKVSVFYWVSQVGMLPGTLAYVNAGTQLSQIDSLQGVVSPRVLLSFAVIGLLPLFSKKLIEICRRKH